jgi:hypothetical protein
MTGSAVGNQRKAGMSRGRVPVALVIGRHRAALPVRGGLARGRCAPIVGVHHHLWIAIAEIASRRNDPLGEHDCVGGVARDSLLDLPIRASAASKLVASATGR